MNMRIEIHYITTKTLHFIPGKRLCAGETYARNFLFLLFSAIFQNFNVSVPDESKLPRQNKTGVVSYMPDHFLKFDVR